ncbi:uncharacterized protein A4U43_C08F5250 [Asparagus officinalis]|nr:uncharacterized protein A4U43_C08F5250 [Asparagus officinalis]
MPALTCSHPSSKIPKSLSLISTPPAPQNGVEIPSSPSTASAALSLFLPPLFLIGDLKLVLEQMDWRTSRVMPRIVASHIIGFQHFLAKLVLDSNLKSEPILGAISMTNGRR